MLWQSFLSFKCWIFFKFKIKGHFSFLQDSSIKIKGHFSFPQDSSIRIWNLSADTGFVTCLGVGRGHTQAVQSVALARSVSNMWWHRSGHSQFFLTTGHQCNIFPFAFNVVFFNLSWPIQTFSPPHVCAVWWGGHDPQGLVISCGNWCHPHGDPARGRHRTRTWQGHQLSGCRP